MANNIAVTPGSGAAIASEQVSDSSQVQLTKLAVSDAGSRVLIPATAAEGILAKVSSIVEPVTVQADSAIPVDASGANVPIVNASGQKIAVSAPVDHPAFVQLSDGTNPVTALPVTGTVTANQGLPAAVGNAHPVKISDGVHVQGLSDVSGDFASKVDVVQTVDPSNVIQDLSAYVEGTDKTQVVGIVYNPTRAGLVGDNHASAARGTPYGDQQVSLMDQAGVALGTNANPVRTSPADTAVTQTVQGTVTAKLADNAGAAFSPASPVPVQIQTGSRTRVTKSQSITASTGGTDLWTPSDNTKKFVIERILLSITVAGPITLYDNANSGSTVIFNGTYQVGNYFMDFSSSPWKSDTANNILRWLTGALTTGTIVVHGHEE